MSIFSACLTAEAEYTTPTAAAFENNTLTAQFTVFLLIQGGLVKKPACPNFAYRQLKSYPVKVREFLKNSTYVDFSGREFKARADELILNMTENKKKNAVLVAAEVFNYISLSITPASDSPGPCFTNSQCHCLPLEVMKAGKGGNLEKTRLAAALLRYFLIPARTAFWNDHYVVQYFLKPLETEKIDPAWHIMDFTGLYSEQGERIEPVSWHPVSAAELLGETWEDQNISLSVSQVKNTRMEINEAEARALFTNIERGNAPDTAGNTAISKYFLLKEITYSVSAQDNKKFLKVDFTLPFNESEPFKTLRYFVKPDEKLKAKFRFAHTMINPPNSGLVYTLPVEFELAGE